MLFSMAPFFLELIAWVHPRQQGSSTSLLFRFHAESMLVFFFPEFRFGS